MDENEYKTEIIRLSLERDTLMELVEHYRLLNDELRKRMRRMMEEAEYAEKEYQRLLITLADLQKGSNEESRA